MAAVRAAEQEWEKGAPWDASAAAWRVHIHPGGLSSIPLQRPAASKIRSGQLVPHLRHWEALAPLADVRRRKRQTK
jgi:hypothetical protein